MDATPVGEDLDFASGRAPQDDGLLARSTVFVRKPGQANQSTIAGRTDHGYRKPFVAKRQIQIFLPDGRVFEH